MKIIGLAPEHGTEMGTVLEMGTGNGDGSKGLEMGTVLIYRHCITLFITSSPKPSAILAASIIIPFNLPDTLLNL